jgi:chemotaxis protein CheX
MILDEMNRLLDAAVEDVFSTMLSMKVERTRPEPGILNGDPHVAGAVAFNGRLTGVVYLHSTAACARRVTSRLLGIAADEIDGDEMVNDAMGELANMVVGHVKSRLSDQGMPCVLTIPSIVRGSNFSIEPVSHTERRVFAFSCEAGILVVEVLIKPGSGNGAAVP